MKISRTFQLDQIFIFWIMTSLFAIILAISIEHLGKIQFGGFDDSILINTAYQLHLGYKPYLDVVTGWPPILLIGSQLAFSLWGVHWSSLITLASIFSGLTFILQVTVFKRIGFPSWLSFMLSITIQAITNLVISWWWYNQITAVAGVLFLSTALLFYCQSRDFFNQSALIVSMILLALSKPNMAGPLLILTTLIFFKVRNLRLKYLSLLGYSLIISLLILWLANMSVIDLVATYAHYAGRAFTVVRAINFIWNTDPIEATHTFAALLPCALAISITIFKLAKDTSKRTNETASSKAVFQSTGYPIIAIGLLGIASGFWGMATNNDFNMNEASFIIFGFTILVLLLLQKTQQTTSKNFLLFSFITSMTLLTAIGVWYAAQRLRIAGIGPFYENASLTTLTSPPLFTGLSVGPRTTRTVNEIQSILKEAGYLNHPDAPVFFGPRVDFGYAAFGIHPYPGIPTWWEFFSRDHVGQTDIMVERFEDANFRLCIFLYHDFIFLPKGLTTYLNDMYNSYDQGELTIFTRKQP